MQPETQYYKAVPVSEKPEPGRITAITKEGKQVPYHYTGSDISFITLREQYTHYLQPTVIPDAAVLRQALSEMKVIVENAIPIVQKEGYTFMSGIMEALCNKADKALSQTGDGWVRVEEKQPQFGEMVWVYDPDTIFPNQYMATWNPCKDDSLPGYFSVGALQGQECWYVTHWKPLPSPPIK